MKILIDNGHGYDTNGKKSPDRSLLEYKWNREVALLILASLKSKGYDAELVVPEENDISLQERCRRTNEWCKKLGTRNVIFVSIHSNAAGSDGKWKSAGGWCVYTSPGQTKADALATSLWNSANSVLEPYKERFAVLKGQGAYDSRQKPMRADWSDGDPDYEARFYVLVHTSCPAVLTESLFYDNKADMEFLLSEEGKQLITQLHVDGIINYIKNQS